MFMAILDIQIVSASLTEIQAGLAASANEITWVQTAYLDRRGGHDPALRLPVARHGHATAVCHLGRRVHVGEPDVRPLHQHQRDDRVACHPGLHRRRHDPHRVRHRLHHLSALADGPGGADDRPGGNACPHHRPHRRRLSHRRALLALAVLHQHRAGSCRHGSSAHPHRLRRARLVSVPQLRLDGSALHGGLPRRARVRARGGPAQRLVRRRHSAVDGVGVGPLRGRLLRARVDGQTRHRRRGRVQGPQFRAWQPVLLRARHRPLRPHLSLSGLSRPDPRLQCAHDRRDHVRVGASPCS